MKYEILAIGYDAIEQAAQDAQRVQLNKYQDATEDAECDLEIAKAREVASEDPSLIFATVRTMPGYTDTDIWADEE